MGPWEVSDWSFQHGCYWVFLIRPGRKPSSVCNLVALEVAAEVAAAAAVAEIAVGGCGTAALVALMDSGVTAAGIATYEVEVKSKILTGADTAKAAAGFVALVVRRPADSRTSGMTFGVEVCLKLQFEAAAESDTVAGALAVLVAIGLQCPADNVGIAEAGMGAACPAGSDAVVVGYCGATD